MFVPNAHQTVCNALVCPPAQYATLGTTRTTAYVLRNATLCNTITMELAVHAIKPNAKSAKTLIQPAPHVRMIYIY